MSNRDWHFIRARVVAGIIVAALEVAFCCWIVAIVYLFIRWGRRG